MKKKYQWFYVKTDAVSAEFKARSFDQAARLFAESEGFAGLMNARDLFEVILDVEGAWIWIEDEKEDRIGGHTPEAARDWLEAQTGFMPE